jgi:hypothetical protein
VPPTIPTFTIPVPLLNNISPNGKGYDNKGVVLIVLCH